ncbi:MAG TPA: hypothetical protein VLY03_05410 [Bacteroidota bacterium]|nr:hypothetical protein [Bacteroidota bacterium]
MKHSAVFLGFFFLLFTLQTVGQVPNTFSYQGLLTTTAGTPVVDGNYKLQFDLFTDSIGGSSFWTEVDSSVSVHRGTFSALLGSATALPDSFHRPLYLQVTAVSGPGIGGPVAFSPRTGLKSTPYALSLRLPFTGSGSAATFNGVFSVSNDQNGSAVSGTSMAGSANVGGVSGASLAPQGNGLYGEALNGNGAWGVYGATDSGVGIAGVSYSKGGFGVQGYSWYQNGYGVYSYGKLRVDAAAGDTSVVLPANSISSGEILDEPGISQGYPINNAYVSGVTSYETVDSTTITIPSSGYVVVEASAQAGLYGTTSGNYMAIEIGDSPGGSISSYYCYVGASTMPNTDYVYLPVTIHRTFYKAAGTYTFYFKALDATLAGLKYLWNASITAVYYPTGYGPVYTVVPPAEAFKYQSGTLAPANVVAGQRTAGTSPEYGVDLRELELNSRRLQEAAQQAENDYLKAKLAKATMLRKPGK